MMSNSETSAKAVSTGKSVELALKLEKTNGLSKISIEEKLKIEQTKPKQRIKMSWQGSEGLEVSCGIIPVPEFLPYTSVKNGDMG